MRPTTPTGVRSEEDTMYATAHLDLVHEAVAEQLRSATRARTAARPVGSVTTPARLRTWGPRTSRRPAAVALADVIRMPAPRDGRPIPDAGADADFVLLDA